MFKTFIFHKPSDTALHTIKELRHAYTALHDLLKTSCPQSRQLAISLTELESSASWAIKAVVFDEPSDTEDELK